MKSKKMVLPVLGLSFLSACVAPSSTRETGAMPPPPMTSRYGKVQPLTGLDARRLIAMFGQPRLDIQDRTVRKLQFLTGGGRCVLDTYLYATARGREPVVTHIDTRLTNGSEADPASCGIR